MSATSWASLFVYTALVVLLAIPLGHFMARVFTGRAPGLERVLGPLERLIYRVCGVDPASEMGWKRYAGAMLAFNLLGLLLTYGIQRLQAVLPLNPVGLPAVRPDTAFNTAVSFVTNTNWQSYGGESAVSHLTQMAALAVQNFVSAATGIACLIALIRGLARRSASTIGNFWVDLVRSTLYILLPLSFVLAVLLAGQGVVQTFSGPTAATLVDPVVDAAGQAVTAQSIPLGPVASQVAIKQLGTNGGGFFNANSCHPLENPTPFAWLLECLAILVIPAGLCITFGRMVGSMRQGWMLLIVMLVLFVPGLVAVSFLEAAPTPPLTLDAIQCIASDGCPGGNMEGKDLRFGIAGTATWAAATTAASNGSVCGMHDSFTPLGGLVAMGLMQLGEVSFGGVGSGLYGLLLYVFVAVFVAGLMIGRTPSCLGKRIEAFDMKMTALAILASPLAALAGTAIAVATSAGRSTIFNPGIHGFSEVLYNFSSAGNNNGSAFAGMACDNPLANGLLAAAMLVGRYLVAVPVLAIAGSLAAKKPSPPGAGTLRTDSILFGAFLTAIVILVGALGYLPALALGPIAEHLGAVR